MIPVCVSFIDLVDGKEKIMHVRHMVMPQVPAVGEEFMLDGGKNMYTVTLVGWVAGELASEAAIRVRRIS